MMKSLKKDSKIFNTTVVNQNSNCKNIKYADFLISCFNLSLFNPQLSIKCFHTFVITLRLFLKNIYITIYGSQKYQNKIGNK